MVSGDMLIIIDFIQTLVVSMSYNIDIALVIAHIPDINLDNDFCHRPVACSILVLIIH